MINLVPAVQEVLWLSSDSLNTAITLTALFSGIFIVAAGGPADINGAAACIIANVIFIAIAILSIIYIVQIMLEKKKLNKKLLIL